MRPAAPSLSHWHPVNNNFQYARVPAETRPVPTKNRPDGWKRRKIVSASGFEGITRLYTEYALSLPRHWKMAAEAGDDGGGGRVGRGEEEGGGGGASSSGYSNVGGAAHGGDFAAGGTTQASTDWPTAPAIVDTHWLGPLTSIIMKIRNRCARVSL